MQGGSGIKVKRSGKVVCMEGSARGTHTGGGAVVYNVDAALRPSQDLKFSIQIDTTDFCIITIDANNGDVTFESANTSDELEVDVSCVSYIID